MINLDKERKIPALVEKQLFQSRQQTLWMISKIVELLPKGSVLGAKDTVQKPSLHENFLVDALCYVVQITGLFQHAIAEIQKLPIDLTSLIAKLLCLMDNEIEAVKYLYKAIKHNLRDPLLLNEQVKLLLKKDQPQLALASALTSIKADPLNFESWYWLTICYILNGDIKAALVSLNSTPMFPQRHKDLVNLDPKDMIQLPEPIEGKVQSVWESTSQVFGANSENLLQFTPRFEVEAVDPALKRVNTNLMKGTHKMAYDTLILMINKIGWEQLLKFRAEVFIMDEEYKSISTVTLHSQAKLPDIKTKRQCERWLDDLFLIIYDDLRITLIVENELNSDKPLKHSALEWELIGLTAYRTGHYSSCVPALRTTISANFDIISSMKLLKLWEYHYLQPQLNKHRWISSKEKVEISLDTILEILLYIISYNVRFYNEFQLDVLLFLKKLCVKFDKEFIKNKIQVSFENDNDDYTNSGVIPPFDKLIETIDTLSHY
jgi:tetratricopeptide (TPR) repeat protein